MRLEFNIAIIDDDLEDPRKSRAISELINNLKLWVENKGFIPILFKATSMEDCLNDKCLDGNQHHNRIDLYLSDNNLGGKNHDGIDLYLQLKNSKLICDFILYTRSDISEIIKKISEHLNEKKDPNLFSRFTFVSRNNDPSDLSWHQPINDVLNHIITSREEINHLRGLFAQVTALIHNKMKEKLKNDVIDFAPAILECKQKGFINDNLKKWLETQRQRRNDIIHNNEEYCPDKKTFIIECKDGKSTRQIYSNANFPKLRSQLLSTKEEFFKQIEK